MSGDFKTHIYTRYKDNKICIYEQCYNTVYGMNWDKVKGIKARKTLMTKFCIFSEKTFVFSIYSWKKEFPGNVFLILLFILLSRYTRNSVLILKVSSCSKFILNKIFGKISNHCYSIIFFISNLSK